MSLVVGVGARRGVTAREVCDLVAAVLREAGRGPGDVVALATVAAKVGEPGLVEAAARLGVPLRAHPADVLARVRVPHPSDAALAATGTPSVAEAAALAEAVAVARTTGPDGPGGTGRTSGTDGADRADRADRADGADGADGADRLTGGELLVPKRRSASPGARVTCAVAVAYRGERLPPEGSGYHRGDAVFDLPGAVSNR
ncbi:cobalamin biosynthesis protein [Streptomyces fradiae]|uniref:cobalamin biosynthesis protein n=1 Tax=Streptomyces fradiae TaxID=1906 RepID=UPI002187D469|nr:cobalamin biosynthesis protein [Streptomyces fradiae]